MKDTGDVRFTAGELRSMAQDCPDFRRMLEKVKPEVINPLLVTGGIYFSGGGLTGPFEPYIAGVLKDGQVVVIGLSQPWNSGLHNQDWFRYCTKPMRDGTITMTVKDGKVAGTTVKED